MDIEEESCDTRHSYKKRHNRDWDDDWDDWGGSSNNNSCYTSQSSMFDINSDSFEYIAVVLALKAKINLSKRNKLYGKLGVSQYYYSLNRNSITLVDESGVGGLAEFGWQFTWDFGLGLNAGIQYWHMDALVIDALAIGVSYNFKSLDSDGWGISFVLITLSAD